MDIKIINFYKSILNSLKIHYSTSQVQAFVEKQPKAITFTSIQDFLYRCDIDSRGVSLGKKERIDKLPFPFIAIYNQQWIIVTGSSDSVQIVGSVLEISSDINSHKEISINKDEFIAKWNGVALLIDTSNSTQDKEQLLATNKKTEKILSVKKSILLICLGCLLTLSIYHNPFSDKWWFYLLLLVNCIGTFICYLLLQKQVHVSNKVSDKLCGLIKQAHCEDVTMSSGGNIMGLLTLSELGFAFFTVNLICLIISPILLDSLCLIAYSVIPFSFWSIWYQKFKAKSWCTLCLFVIVLMWSQGVIYIFDSHNAEISYGSLYGIIVLGCLYMISVLATNYTMSKIEHTTMLKSSEANYNQLKSDCRVIRSIMGGRQKFDISEDNCSVLIFGDKTAKTTITVFSNPYCSPCAQLHKQIEYYPGNNVKVQYVLTYFTKELSIANKYIIACYNQYGPKQTWDILSKWYNKGKERSVDFFTNMNLEIDQNVISEFEKHEKWIKQASFIGTPTILINGTEIVWPYDIDNYPELTGCL